MRAVIAWWAAAILAPAMATSAPTVPAPYSSGAISAMNGNTLSELPARRWKRQLRAMRSHGVQLVRSDADWGTIEPDRPRPSGPSWQFAKYDAWVTALALQHLTWQPILGYNNSWALAVRDNAAFASFGRAVAARYGVGGSFWSSHPRLPYEPVTIIEVWNEENAQPWNIDPLAYGTLYAATRSAIHAVDSQVSVDVGGLADDSENFNAGRDFPVNYVLRMLLAEPWLQGKIDGFALHPYGTTANDVLDWTTDFRSMLDRFNESGVPIDITEFGWVTGDADAEAWRAAQMSLLGPVFASGSWGVREVAPYDWVNPTILHDAGDFGFVNGSSTSTVLRPAAVAWFQSFGAGTAVRQVCTKRARHRHKARRGHRHHRRKHRCNG